VEYALGMAAAVLLGTSFVLQQNAAQQIPADDLLRLRLGPICCGAGSGWLGWSP
jgi:hypothetical protein